MFMIRQWGSTDAAFAALNTQPDNMLNLKDFVDLLNIDGKTLEKYRRNIGKIMIYSNENLGFTETHGMFHGISWDFFFRKISINGGLVRWYNQLSSLSCWVDDLFIFPHGEIHYLGNLWGICFMFLRFLKQIRGLPLCFLCWVMRMMGMCYIVMIYIFIYTIIMIIMIVIILIMIL